MKNAPVQKAVTAAIVTRVMDECTSKTEVRAGAKGTGRVLFAVNYWPDSSVSVEEADKYLSAWRRMNPHVTIVETEG